MATASAIEPRFFLSNSLRFALIQDYSLYQTDTTRLYYDFNYQNIYNTCYFQKYLQSKNITFQFNTEYQKTSITITLVDSSGVELDLTSSLLDITDFGNGIKQYEVVIDTSGLTGKYYIKVDFNEFLKPILNYQSEWFNIQTSHENTLIIEWYNNNEFRGYPDGRIWSSDRQYLMIESRLSNLIPGSSKNVYTDSAYSEQTTKSHPLKSKLWEVELLPDFMIEKINIALNHTEFYINGEQYNSENNQFDDLDRQGDTRLYPFSMVLNLVRDIRGNKYENYTENQIITGEAPPLVDNYLLINDTDKLLINNTDVLKISGE